MNPIVTPQPPAPFQVNPHDPLGPLVSRFGPEVAESFYRWMIEIQRMYLQGVHALNQDQAAAAAVCPDAVALVLRLPSDNPDGDFGVMASGQFGILGTDAKKALLSRALECLEADGGRLRPAVETTPKTPPVAEGGAPPEK